MGENAGQMRNVLKDVEILHIVSKESSRSGKKLEICFVGFEFESRHAYLF